MNNLTRKETTWSSNVGIVKSPEDPGSSANFWLNNNEEPNWPLRIRLEGQWNNLFNYNSSDQQLSLSSDLAAAVSPAGASALPAGAVSYFCRLDAPEGWLVADGATISRSEFSDLFEAIGTHFGEGDGSTTFQLPELQDEFIRGSSSTRAVGVKEQDAMQNITGRFKVAGLNGGIDAFDGALYKADGNGDYNRASVVNNGAVGIAGFDASRVVRTADETRPRNIALLTCIKI